MSENKTKPTEISVEEFIRNSDPNKVEDSFELVMIMEKLSGEKATMWGPSIIGFGNYHYKYESGREGEMCRIGFSPRKSAFSLYVLHCDDSENELISQLGKIKMAKGSCIYFKKLADLNTEVLEQLIVQSLKKTKELYG
ncbi:DUF1801 domain-containing protein [Chryseobacterium suipulveris]|uniref:DUF1801 domain-containing protein n=1 Tax=Chryseobacterium suipulveris TaxID=2929800 RepID=A0ABY4BSU5_9FLAO|nr:DUF1801 domain-containing protein [Chryseobacterium suipulveris]UOE41994.1 DUF1801 domain-containing protein [Chryseobacterium suipulveris]